jgi:arsenite oxidase small subunit
MSDAPKNSDPFHPTTPSIPGVNHAAGVEGDAHWKAPVQKTLLLVAALAAGALSAWWALRSPRPVVTGPAARPETASHTAAAAGPDRVGPVEVTTLRELAKPWSFARFVFRKPLTGETVPAMVVRLPGGRADRTASYWAFSLKRPFGRCELEYVTDLSKLASQYGYRARHPMVGDPCTRAVYDPLRTGSIAGGAWARGEIVQGAGIRPPMAVEVRIQGDRLMATRME